ncbi:Cu-binding protein [Pichia californica]|nr:Cu-binding protein [[Candida] californica]
MFRNITKVVPYTSRYASKGCNFPNLIRNISNSRILLNDLKKEEKPEEKDSLNTKKQYSRRPLSSIPIGEEEYSSQTIKRKPVEYLSWKSFLLFLCVGGGLTYLFRSEKEKLQLRKEAEANRGVGKPLIGGPFNLITEDGKPFTEKDLIGKFSIIYFGFTHCPDICPDELDKLGLILNDLKKNGIELQPIFISCDPVRDTPEVLKEYLSEFHNDIIGLTGDYDEVKKCCRNYRVYFSTPRDLKPGEDYLVDHSIFFYLMDPEGEFIDVLGRNYDADGAVTKIIKDVNAYEPRSVHSDASTPVWIIPETGEWFINYEDYLDRMSFYNVKKFVCETSGNSNFTFFEALKVEHNELFSMQSNFPEPVKEPILRHVSFSTVPRIDLLVDQVYSKFKDQFFPGDKVIVKYTGGYRAHGIIKEKVVFNSRLDSNGIIQSPFISYRVYLPADENEIVIEDASLLYRERNRFTKSYVKTFLKMSLIRSNRLGAPWVIRDEIAKKYKITLEWPPQMKKFDNKNFNNSSMNRINILNDDDNNSNNNGNGKQPFFKNFPNNTFSEGDDNDDDDDDNNEDGIKKNSKKYTYNSFHKIPVKAPTKIVPVNTSDSTIKYRLKQKEKKVIPEPDPEQKIEIDDSMNTEDEEIKSQVVFNQNENSLDYGMRSTRGFSHSIFENLKETPPAFDDLYEKWCENWYEILKKTTAYVEDLKTEDRAREKALKLFEFAGVKIVDYFDPENTHFIVTQRPFNSKETYSESDPFYYVHLNRIKVWHYEKCQRFFKSIKISNRRIDQIAKKQAIKKGIEVIDYLSSNADNNSNNNNDNTENLTTAQPKFFVNIAPAPTTNSDIEDIKPKTSKGKGKNNGKAKVKGNGKGKGKVKKESTPINNEENEENDGANSKNNINNNINNDNTNSNNKKSKSKSKNGKNSKDNISSDIKSEETSDVKNIEPEQQSIQSQEKKSHKPIIIDDLLLPTKTENAKPNWKKLAGTSEDLHFNFDECPITTSNVLEVWIFINMFHDAFIIDTFTFDDFIYALQWKDSTKPCPLLLEIFCALLTCIMNKEGGLLITLPIDIESEIAQREAEMKEKKLLKEREKQEREEKIVKIENGEDEDEDDDDDDEDDDENDDENESSHKKFNSKVLADSVESDIKKEDKDNEEEEEEEEEINHNAYSMLEYKKVSWKELLKKRRFKDGQWLLILLGIFSMTEFIPEYKKEIVKIYEILAPLDETPTPEKLMINFYENVTPVKRIFILSLLMNLLLNGDVIRDHTDNVVDKSASLRRERFELQKDLKSKIEIAHNANKDVLDALRLIDIKEIKQRIEDHELEALNTEEEKEKWLEIKNKGGRPIQNTLPPEPSALEKAVAAGHPDFLLLLNIRTEKINDVEMMKNERLNIDKTLVELNCQRIRYLGRDKFWNRYWWFERNGLPNLGGNKDDDEENEDNEDHDDVDNLEDSDIRKKDDENNEYDSETYLMGRIWIQGPSNTDMHHLRVDDDIGLKRKIVEEGKDILNGEFDWVYVDEIEDVNKLMTWLNDRGIRERALKKELNECKDQVISSFKARTKFLKGGDRQARIIQYIKDLEDGAVAKIGDDENMEVNDESEVEAKTKEDAAKEEQQEENDENDEIDVDADADEEEEDNDEIVVDEEEGQEEEEEGGEVDNDREAIVDADSGYDSDDNLRITRSTRSMRTRGKTNVQHVVEEPLRRSKRNAPKEVIGVKTRSKRRRVMGESPIKEVDEESIEEEEEDDDEEDDENDENKRKKEEDLIGNYTSFDDTPVEKEQTEEEKLDEMIEKFQLPASDDPPGLRERLLIRARSKLQELEIEHREENMVLWVNSYAIEEQGYTHYIGPKVVSSVRSRKSKGKATKATATTKGKGGKGKRR